MDVTARNLIVAAPMHDAWDRAMRRGDFEATHDISELQRTIPPPDPMRTPRHAVEMKALDLVISVDSMPAHLAGALGVPVWTLLPAPGDWPTLIARVAEALEVWSVPAEL